MALKPEDRYPSPRALAEDIEHWLADEPVAPGRSRGRPVQALAGQAPHPRSRDDRGGRSVDRQSGHGDPAPDRRQ